MHNNKQFIIYKVTNKLNNKIYIGSTTKSLKFRWYKHKFDAKNGNAKFYRAIRKYGIENFIVEHFCSVLKESDLEQIEHEFILYFDSIKKGYNSIGILKGSRELIKNVMVKEWEDKKQRKIRIDSFTKAHRYRMKPLVSVHIQSGNVIHYESIHAAKRAKFSISSIYACLNNEAKTGQKHCWFYKEDNLTDEYYKNKALSLIGNFKEDFCKPIIGYFNKLEGVTFKDVYHASEITKLEVKTIRRMLKGKYAKTYHSWSFSYTD